MQTLPLYTRLKEHLIAAIASGEYPPGARLPSQRDLCERFAASHMTVRRVIDELQHEGVITSIPGKGLFVAERRQQAESHPLHSFSQDMAARGVTASSDVLDARTIAASTVIAGVLRLAPAAPVVYLRRRRLANHEPIAIQTAYLPHARCPGLLEENLAASSLFHLLRQRYRLRLARSESTVTSGLADLETAELLGLAIPAPLLITEQITYLEDGTPIEFVRSAYRGDRYEVRFRG